jgi:Protein of unknown function (DUF1553)/Protein of unknown function (DUF1549)/Planctomycete cytochrome C
MLASSMSVRTAEPDSKAGIEFFEKKIRPVLVDQCYKCHSAEMESPKGGLLLDTRDSLLKGGESGPAIVPGKPDLGLLIKAIRHADGLKMPPKGKLADTVVADFVKWVEMGAPDPRVGKATFTPKRIIDLEAGRKSWAFQPVGTVAPPAVQNQAWPRTPVDRFILARLEEKKLAPSPAAGREKLVRRAYYDAWGLPPTPEQLEAALNDKSAEWFGKVVDQLLDSPRHGERWARHWLDVVRFAESGGYEFDGDRAGAYLYRDFVIQALNEDMPYSEFVRRQVAGDHLRPGDFRSATATGFLVAGPYPGQTTQHTLEIIRYDHLDDMISTLGTSMLGLSLGCARCHEHKFDPIPQEDYYRMVAALARTDSSATKLDPNPEVYRQAKATFDQAHAPLVAARDKFDKEELPNRVRKWQQAEAAQPPPAWLILDTATPGKTNFKKQEDGSQLATGAAPKTETYIFTAQTHQKGITAIRLEALADASLPKSGPGRGPDGNFVLTSISLGAAPLKDGAKAKPAPVKLRAAQATFEQKDRTIAAAIAGDKKSGWSVGGETGKSHAAVFETETEVGHDGGSVLTVTLKFESDGFAMGRPRLAIATSPRPVKLDGPAALQNAREVLALLEASQGQLDDKNRAQVTRWFRALDVDTNKVHDAVEQHDKQTPEPKLSPAFVATSGRGGDVHFLIRGETNRKNGVAKPGFVQVLMNAPERDQRWTTTASVKGPAPVEPRTSLANWLVDTDHGAGHLLARVIVNRLWQHHLGRGLVATPNDFGAQGEPPTHPELLDYLAGELIRGGWKLKPLHKLIMTSAVYMQGNETTEASLKADPANRLWGRRPARRLEAEAIRDALLAVSGTLDTTMYGPGTLDENVPRRSVYLTVKRSRLIPLLQMFDAPEAIQSIGGRQTTTVATQALAMMNAPFVRQRADKFAQRVRPKSAEGLPQAVDDAYRIALARRPTAVERERMLAYVAQQIEGHGKDPKALDLALTDFCQVLLCLNEFVYVD